MFFITNPSPSPSHDSDQQIDGPPQYTPNDQTARASSSGLPSPSTKRPLHSKLILEGQGSPHTDPGTVDQSAVATTSAGPQYLYYRVYAEGGAIPSKKSVSPDDPSLGRIKTTAVAPPHSVASLKRCLGRSEEINENILTSLFSSPYSEYAMDDSSRVAILNHTGPGTTPQEPLAFVAKLLDSRSSDLDSEVGEPQSPLEHGPISPSTRFFYYRLYNLIGDIPSKTSIDPEEPSLGRIRADSVTPPHTPTSIKQSISRVEKDPSLTSASLYADISYEIPMKDAHISLFGGGLGLSPDQPLALVHAGELHAQPHDEGLHDQSSKSKSDYGSNAQAIARNMEPGTLTVTVIDAKNLPTSDITPYVILRLSSDKEFRTRNARRASRPRWNESFSFAAGVFTPKLLAWVHDHRRIGKDRLLGETELDIWQHINPNSTSSADVTMKFMEGLGQLRVRLDFDVNKNPNQQQLPRSSSMHSLDVRSIVSSSRSRFSVKGRRSLTMSLVDGG